MRAPGNRGQAAGFTLIELIVVMALLSVTLALAAPQLGRFMTGRGVREEARRMVSLTRHARDEAIARGEAVQVWFDPQSGRYGMKPLLPEALSTVAPLEFTLREGLTMSVAPEALGKDGLATIVFQPDGEVDAESVERVELYEDGALSLALARLETGLDYTVEEAGA